jgi:hypothetical protein
MGLQRLTCRKFLKVSKKGKGSNKRGQSGTCVLLSNRISSQIRAPRVNSSVITSSVLQKAQAHNRAIQALMD